MESASFDTTLEFKRFKEQMRKLIAVPKERIDALVEQARKTSSRQSNPKSPGRKRSKRTK